MYFTIDGDTWYYPFDVSRSAEIRSTDVSGWMMNGRYYNDVQGTYFSYTIKMAVPLDKRDVVGIYFEKLVAPVGEHTFVFPYNQSTITLVGRVESVSDVFVRLYNDGQYWKGLQFTVVSNTPNKEISFGDYMQRGLSPLPDVSQPAEGDTWRWHNGQWEVYNE